MQRDEQRSGPLLNAVHGLIGLCSSCMRRRACAGENKPSANIGQSPPTKASTSRIVYDTTVLRSSPILTLPLPQIIRKAVSSMLPKNTFRQRRLERLKIFMDAQNPYEGNVMRVFRAQERQVEERP